MRTTLLRAREVVVFDAGRDGGRGNRPIHPRRDVQAQFHGVGEGRLQAASDRIPDFVGQPAGQFERDQYVIVLDERNDPECLIALGEDRRKRPEEGNRTEGDPHDAKGSFRGGLTSSDCAKTGRIEKLAVDCSTRPGSFRPEFA